MALPVSKDGFFHSGDSFYVEIDRHRHTRLDSGSLFGLLTRTKSQAPLLTKLEEVPKKQPEPHKEPPGHFYIAQLKHYGLQSFKTKVAAKKHLLAAFDPVVKTLAVPEHILEIEKSLAKEFAHADAIAKEEEKKLRVIEERNPFKGQESDENAVLMTVSKNTFDDEDDDGEYDRQSTARLCNDISALPEAHLRVIMKNLVFMGSATVKRRAKREMATFSQAAPTKQARLLEGPNDEQGEYNILAPHLRDQWPRQTQIMKLKISQSLGESHLWAWFHFGVVSGIMRSCGPLPNKAGDVVHFIWRGREEGEGEMSYDEELNTVCITFVGDGRIRGRMQWMGEWEFVGTKVERPNVVWVKSVPGWKAEWRGINNGSYAAASAARWGQGWYRDEGGDTSNSDTDSANEEENMMF